MRSTQCLRVIIALLCLGVPSSVYATENIVTPAMAGRWDGRARIIVAWCQQTNLAVSVDIRPDGSVTGKVGDATLTSGRMKRNRGWLGRKLNIKSDCIVVGNLEGPIVAKEGIARRAVSMPLNFRNGTFVDGVHTSGSHMGGKHSMVLSAQRLTLVRANSP